MTGVRRSGDAGAGEQDVVDGGEQAVAVGAGGQVVILVPDPCDGGARLLLTLCGERSAQTFESLPRSLFRQVASRLARTPLATWLDPL